MRYSIPLFAAALAAVPFLPARAAPAAAPDLQLAACHIDGPYGLNRIEARCGELRVPENPAEPEGRQIGLHVAVLKARTAEPAPDPVFFIAGGPGQAATEGYVSLQNAFAAVRERRDIVLVDQRGTGESHALNCPAVEDPLDTAPDPAELRSEVARCLDQLTGNPRFYTTSVAVDDLDAVRAALGYENINLYGISYGSRVALHYLREYPARVRSLVLDGVAPPDIPLGADIATAAQAALDALFRRCAGNPDCAAAFPGLENDFATLLESAARPQSVHLRDPLSGAQRTFEWQTDHLRGAVRLLSYSTESAALLPLLLHQAAAGDLQPLAAQTVMVAADLAGSLSTGMHNSVVCTEDEPFIELDPQERARIRDTYLGLDFVQALQTTCSIWPAGVLDEDFKKPVQSDKPVLLLSGEYDPVTPPAWAAHAAETLSNSRSVIAPGQGHGVAARGCLPRVMAQFYRQAAVAELDTACVQELEPAPFFLRFTGPNP